MDSLSPSTVPKNRSQLEWENVVFQQTSLVDQQTKIFLQIVDANKNLEEKVEKTTKDVNNLHKEVEIWKKAYFQEQQENERAKRDANILKTQLAGLECQKDRDPMVLALIDGDGYIFKDELLKHGVDGGREAAQILKEKIMAHIISQDEKGGARIQIWTYVFFNLQGLKQTLVGCDVCTCAEFEAFVTGFNQANPRFTIYDAHSGKEAADSKIRAYLQTWSRFPQTLKIYFGGTCGPHDAILKSGGDIFREGGHDNGYLPTLAELQSDGLLEKIVLLQGYEQVAAEIRSLHLQTLKIEGLFRSYKIQVPGKPSAVTRASMPSPPRSASPSPKMLYTNAVSSHPIINPIHPSSPGSVPSASGRRFPNPNVELHKNNPPPCNLFYLAKCSRSTDCKYSHDYILNADQYEMLSENARKSPCLAVNSNSPCPYGENCAFGHKCPHGPQCFYRKLDKCWFKGKTMHL